MAYNKPTGRKCGGVPAQPAWEFETASGEVGRVSATEHEPGCGETVEVRYIGVTVPTELGDRPLFKRRAPVILCPHCDRPPAVPELDFVPPEFAD